MDAPKTDKNSYYQRNKTKYQKGGKYYKYIPKHKQNLSIKFKVNKGSFLLYFD